MPPFGIVAVVYSKRCIRDVQNGRIQSSWRHSKTALLLGLGGLLTLCVLFLVLACIYLGIHFTNAYTNQYYFQNKSQNIDTQWTTPKTTTVTETKTTTTTTAVYSTTISIKQTSTAMSFLKTVNQQNYKNFLQLLNSDSRLPSNEDIRKGQEDLKNRDSLIQDFLQYKNISGEKEWFWFIVWEYCLILDYLLQTNLLQLTLVSIQMDLSNICII